MINLELRSINWSDRFDELDVDQAVHSFTNCFLSVITQHIPNREITCCDRDAPWITDEVKKAIKRKHRVHRKYVTRGRKPDDWMLVKQIKTDTAKMTLKIIITLIWVKGSVTPMWESKLTGELCTRSLIKSK